MDPHDRCWDKEVGVRLISLIATLRTVMRLPLRQIRDLLQMLHGVQVSVGELVEVLHCLVAHAHPRAG